MAQGVRKLLYGAEGGLLTGSAGGPLAAESDTDQTRLMAAAGAASDRRRVRFGYRTATGSAGRSRGRCVRRGVPRWTLVPGRARPRPRRHPGVPALPRDGRTRRRRGGVHAARRLPRDRPCGGRPLERRRRRRPASPSAPRRPCSPRRACPAPTRERVRDDGWTILSVPAAGRRDPRADRSRLRAGGRGPGTADAARQRSCAGSRRRSVAKRAARASSVEERLARMLVVVPYLIQHPGHHAGRGHRPCSTIPVDAAPARSRAALPRGPPARTARAT